MAEVDECIFCKVVRGKISAYILYKDDHVVAFHDINPQAPVHFMLVPKRHIDSLATCQDSDAAVLGRMFAMVGRLANQQGATDGFRTIVNTGRVGRQDVYHLHIHILGGKEPLGRMLPREDS
jgi:histidine triad (HIT) family protein